MIFEINSFYDMHRASNETTKMRNKLNEMTHFVFIQLFLFRFFAPLILWLTFCVLHGKNVPLHDKKMYRLATISRFGLALLHMWKIRALRFEPYSYKALTFCSPSAASSFCFDAFAGYWFLYAYKWHLFGIYFLPTNCINQMNDFDIRISCNGLPPPKLLEMRQKART